MVHLPGSPTTVYGSLMSNKCNNSTRETSKYNRLGRHSAQPSIAKEEQESNLYFSIKGHPRGYNMFHTSFFVCFSALIKYDYPSEFKSKQLWP